MSFAFGNNSVPSFNLNNNPASTPAPAASLFPSATTNIGSSIGQSTASTSTFGQQPATTTFGTGGGFKFGTGSSTVATQPAVSGFSFGANAAKPASLSATVPSIPLAQTQSGIPFPKETKFVDLPADVRTAIEALEKTIRKYETDSCQLSTRHLQEIDKFKVSVDELGKKMNSFEFALNQSRGKLLLAKRSLNQYWKYGESVARYITGVKQAATPGAVNIDQPPLNLSDLKFVESIILDLEKWEQELEHLYRTIKDNLDSVQSQSPFSVGSLKSVIRSNGEALINLTTAFSTLHNEIDFLRDEYRRFNLVHRNDSRDPFSPKVISAPNHPIPPAAAPIVAPSLNSLIPQSQPASLFSSLPSATTFIKRSF